MRIPLLALSSTSESALMQYPLWRDVDPKAPTESHQPRYREVYQRFKDAILQETYPHGARIPSIRTIASELGLSRTTVERAFDLLIGEGLLVSRGQSGTSVAYVPPCKPAPRVIADANSSIPECNGDALLDAPDDPSPPEANPFRICVPAIDAFPRAAWLKISQRVLKDRLEMCEVVDDIQGHHGLREAICGYLGLARGISCKPHQIFITSGYRQSLGLLVSALVPRGAAVWAEDPGYLPTYAVLNQFGSCPVPVAVDAEGIDVEAGRRAAPFARMAVTTPTKQSPLGICMSLRRRSALIDWASETGAWIVEDDFDSEFCFDGMPLPALKNLDVNGRIFYLGTFSRTLHPNLRIAYIVAPEGTATTIRKVASAMLDGVSLAQQKVLAAFISDGHFALHIRKSRNLYAARRKMVVDTLTSRFGARLPVSPTSRGLQILVTTEGLDDVAICTAASQHGLDISSLSSRYIRCPPKHGLLLGFANFVAAAQLSRSIDVLQKCLDDAAIPVEASESGAATSST
jgi:GntR family transcriptional regulator / MocR family aminotransferase